MENETKMKLVPFGKADFKVSKVCLGTMTWGIQNTAAEAEAQLDYAIHRRGVNFLDTSERYPIPTTSPFYSRGKTETILGNWLSKQDPDLRKKLVIATKITGYAKQHKKIGRSPGCLSRADVGKALAGSLERLQCEYVDLYQVHWPSRYVPIFGDRMYRVERERDGEAVSEIRETLLGIKDGIESGKIREYGVCNESTFGLCEWVRISRELGMKQPVSIQNSFCLLDRVFEGELAEACAERNLGVVLMPWSVLAGGCLSGKYLNGGLGVEDRARFKMFPEFQDRYRWKISVEATKKYKIVAEKAGLNLATMSQAFCKSRWFVPSTIIGATNLDQLKENIDAIQKVDLDPKTLQAIDDIHMQQPNPCMRI